jgi:hypothetical protein
MSLALNGRFTPHPMQASIHESASGPIGVPRIFIAPTPPSPSSPPTGQLNALSQNQYV